MPGILLGMREGQLGRREEREKVREVGEEVAGDGDWMHWRVVE